MEYFISHIGSDIVNMDKDRKNPAKSRTEVKNLLEKLKWLGAGWCRLLIFVDFRETTGTF